jgi:hypothetical protein
MCERMNLLNSCELSTKSYDVTMRKSYQASLIIHYDYHGSILLGVLESRGVNAAVGIGSTN